MNNSLERRVYKENCIFLKFQLHNFVPPLAKACHINSNCSLEFLNALCSSFDARVRVFTPSRINMVEK